ncbi:MAG TPA: hypothetical protein DEH25_06985 [Chloroflexi bacterium]|nr:hypothetical protein [Chloroflexota bacterium]HBY08611.1 hypothetical protein [Chloroflexota bacterium]
MNFMFQTRGRRFVLYILVILAGMLISGGVMALIGYNSNQNLPSGPQITDRMDALDKIRLAEALHLKSELGDEIWPGYAALEAPLVIWNKDYEFLFGINNPPAGWEPVPEDTFAEMAYYRRPADDPQNFAVQVGHQWAASISTKYTLDMSLISAIKENMPPGIVEIFPYRIFILPSEFQISAVPHEYLHVVEAEMAPDKFEAANASYAQEARYWARDAEMRAAWKNEIELLIKAEQTLSEGDTLERVRQFLAARQQRRADFGLDADLIAYETQIEWLEGLAKFAELRNWQLAAQNHGYVALPEMGSDPDFKDYETFDSHWDQEISQTRHQANVEGDVRFYYTGMLQAFLLDRLMPDWQARIMDEGVYLEDLLREAVTD